jgi:transcriptional regulator GlxA family with amidase domain
MLDRDRIFVRDGKIYTSAGATAGLDLALAFVEEDFGRDVALAVARALVMFLKRPGGQPQVSAQLAAQMTEKSTIQQIQEWVLENPAKGYSVNDLADRASMSVRNFSRVFRRETKMAPAQFLVEVRMQTARRMLADTNEYLQRIAYFSGFGNVDTMRRTFIRTLGVSPSDYRRSSRSTMVKAKPNAFAA